MKKTAILLMLFIVAMTTTNQIDASNVNYNNKQIEKAYIEVIKYADSLSIDYEITIEDFIFYFEQSNLSLDQFVQLYLDEFDKLLKENLDDSNIIIVQSSSSSGVPGEIDWQYNTGTELPQEANYDTCNLIEKVEPGYIVYESEGSGGLTGHIAIVEGVFYSTTHQQYYIRVIEAISTGVSRSVIDCDRFDLRGGELFFVEGSTELNRDNVVQYAIDQLGKSYALDLDSKDCDEDDFGWYCSQLAYCAYKEEGFDIEVAVIGWFGIITRGDVGVTPSDIIADDDTVAITVSFISPC